MTKASTTGDLDTHAYRPCVGIMLINRDGLIWVGRRAAKKARNEGSGSWWQMPQGGIDENEDPAAAARRELYEETGITSVEAIAELPHWLTYELPISLIPNSWGGRYRGQRQKWFAMRFVGEDSEVNIIPAAGHQIEFEDWRWAPIADLVGLIVPFKRKVYEEVVAEFSKLEGVRR